MSRNDGELEDGQIAPLPFNNDGSFLERAALELRKREVEARLEQRAATADVGAAVSHGGGSGGGNASSCGGRRSG